MSKFKGTRGAIIIFKDNIIKSQIFIMSDEKPIVRIALNNYVKQNEAEANANLIVDAFKVRQQINCELSELKERHDEMLAMLEEFESDLRRGYVINSSRLNKIQQLIKKVKDNE